MIISHTHRYLFVEIPNTGSTAIAAELRENYDGVKILYKHATYSEFRRIASAEEKTYFVFSGIRNPLDEAVTHYFRFRNNHRQNYTKPQKHRHSGGWVSDKAIRWFQWFQTTQPDFPTFFKRRYKVPYDNWGCSSHHQFDYIMRFERLQEDFAEVLKRLGLMQIRPLPTVNPTVEKGRDYLSYYTPELYPLARRIFGPFMLKWGYRFPPEWGEVRPSLWNRIEFAGLRLCRRLYWAQIRRASRKGDKISLARQ